MYIHDTNNVCIYICSSILPHPLAHWVAKLPSSLRSVSGLDLSGFEKLNRDFQGSGMESPDAGGLHLVRVAIEIDMRTTWGAGIATRRVGRSLSKAGREHPFELAEEPAEKGRGHQRCATCSNIYPGICFPT